MGKNFTVYISDKGLVSQAHRKLLYLNKKEAQQNKVTKCNGKRLKEIHKRK